MQEVFDFVEGVVSTEAGYAEVDGKWVEAVNIIYDDEKVSYERLLSVYWHNIDPEDEGGQFADRGEKYKTYIFYYDEDQRSKAEKSKQELLKTGRFKKIATKIVPFKAFKKAEPFHQKFYLKFPERYKSYKEGSGRGPYLRRVWGYEELSAN